MRVSMKKLDSNIDTQLVKSFQSGDKKKLAELVKRWHVTFCKLAFWYCKDADAAKDIAQECWIVISNKLSTLQKPNQFKSWAISIVNRKSIDWLRKNKREQNNLHNYYNLQDKIQTESEIEKSETLSKLNYEINKLPENQRVIIKLFYLENYSLKQMAEVLKISVGTVKSRLFHAREKLKITIKTEKL